MKLKNIISFILVLGIGLSLVITKTVAASNDYSDNEGSIDMYAAYVTVSSANSTAYSMSQYLSDGKLRRTHSGKVPAWGMAAAKYGEIPFGVTITTSSNITHPIYGSRKNFSIEDSGNGWRAYGDTWIDFWWGFCSTCKAGDTTTDNYDRARTYGVRQIAYSYFIP